MIKLYLLVFFVYFANILNAQERIDMNLLSNSNAQKGSDFDTFYESKKATTEKNTSSNITNKQATPTSQPPKAAFEGTQFSNLTKEQYLIKFYEVWDISKINTNKSDVFYILPSLQNAITYTNEVAELNKNPPKKNAKNYQKLLQAHKKKITDLESKVKRLLGVGENLLPYSVDEFAGFIDNMNLSAFLQSPKTGIITHAGFIRAVPTYKPRYKSKDDFPFDRWQNSLVFEGTPVMITHFSKDKRYAHVQTPFVIGWIDARNVALVDNSMRNKILKFDDYKIATSDFVPLYYQNQWVLDARIGQILPFNRRSGKLITFYKDVDNFAQIRELDFDAYKFVDFPVPFSADKMSSVINTMLGQKYGWGGIFGNRDCSSFTRDSFATFGVFLPRNSAAQAKFKGAFMDLSKMSEAQKEEYIIANGVPFGSIIWLKGHIMLYIGHTNIGGVNRAIVAHNAWSAYPTINNKKEKIRLGGVKITTMHIGGAFTSNVKMENSILTHVKGITNIYADSTNSVDISKLNIEY